MARDKKCDNSCATIHVQDGFVLLLLFPSVLFRASCFQGDGAVRKKESLKCEKFRGILAHLLPFSLFKRRAGQSKWSLHTITGTRLSEGLLLSHPIPISELSGCPCTETPPPPRPLKVNTLLHEEEKRKNEGGEKHSCRGGFQNIHTHLPQIGERGI